MTRAYYNEIDPKSAAWLRELIKAGHITEGDVDERSISDVAPNDLKSYDRCHFFAGIGTWGLALKRAHWPSGRRVWTGSCPCQPFSAAGKGAGFADERHLWPHFHWLISQCRPDTVFGEQVASKDGLAWLDLVQSDMEAEGYAVGAVDTCAAGFGAPHIRQRLYWVADDLRAGPQGWGGTKRGEQRPHGQVEPCGVSGGLADADNSQRRPDAARGNNGNGPDTRRSKSSSHVEGCSELDRLANNKSGGRREEHENAGGLDGGDRAQGDAAGSVYGGAGVRPSPTNGHWADVDWLGCRDGKWRPVESGTFPLAHGVPARMGRLRGYGNAIVAPQAQAFIEAYLES